MANDVILLKFGASWCMPCRVLEKSLEGFDLCELKKYDIDDDDAYDLAVKYGIRAVPVLILVDKDGTELKRWVGLQPIQTIKNEISSFL